MYDFNLRVDRSKTSSVKYEELDLKFGRSDLMPFWVADMDLKSPAFMIETLVERAEHGVFGYTKRMPAFYESISGWLKSRHGVVASRDEIEYGPGVVFLLNMMIRKFTQPGDKIIIQSPVYYPFKSVVEGNGRLVSDNALVQEGMRYHMDFDDLAAKAQEPDCSMMILCSPHNPVGRVWTEEELIRVADICVENDVILVSDEIHFDLVYKGHQHHSVAKLDVKYQDRTIVCTAPSKTFNIAGLHSAYCIIRNQEMMEAYRGELGLLDLNRSNVFSRELTQAVYEQGHEYVDDLVDFLEENMDFAIDYIQSNIEGILPHRLEATYLLWMDCKGLGLSSEQLDYLFFEEAGIALDSGHWFGDNGHGFMRLNIACSRDMLAEGLERLNKAIGKRR